MVRKQVRPKMTTKEELMFYLEDNKENELPFNEEVWNIAVEKTKDKQRKFLETSFTDFDGVTKKKIVPNGSVNPVGKYLQMIALPQYSKKPKVTKEEYDSIEIYSNVEENYSFDTIDEEKYKIVSNWIDTFFNDYDYGDKKFLKERLSDYYDNYELNDGADKLLAIMSVTDELEMMKLTKLRAKGKDVEMKMQKMRSSYIDTLDSLKALKKQRGAVDEGKNKLTQWVEELTKAGDFKPKEYRYEQDQIDNMIFELEKSIMQVLREG